MSNTEPWQYGKEAQRIITEYIRLRYQLFPYIYSEAAKISFQGSTLMRPLVFDFSGDKEALNQEQEYMFGSALLINPVTEKGVSVWPTYLPENQAGWYDYWTGEKYMGGQTVDVSVNMDRIPVFVKGGSILPKGPDRQFVKDQKEAPIEFYIYSGSDASFRLYEDEGTNYDYEKGAYSVIGFYWDEKKQRLTVDAREGTYLGMPEERTFIIHLGDKQQTVNYIGDKVNIDF